MRNRFTQTSSRRREPAKRQGVQSEALPNATQPHARVSKRPSTELNRSRRQAAFLKAFSAGGIVLRAAQETGVSRRTIYWWLADDPVFKAKFDLAIEDAADLLEAEARRRAEFGWEEPVYQGGQQVGVVRKYSDALMITLLKAMKPDVYKDRVEADVISKATATIDPRSSSDAELAERLERAAAILRAGGATSPRPIPEPNQAEEGSSESAEPKRGGR
jgi:hypothetical protein